MAVDLEAMSPADAEFARRHLRIEPRRFNVVISKAAKSRDEPKMSTPELEFMKRARCAVAKGNLFAVEYQPPPFELEGNTTYRADFRLWLSDSTSICVETKARWMHSENVTRMKLRQCSDRYPEHTWWLARWDKRLPWRVVEVSAGVIRRKAVVVPWLS
jgi:hypothetical protein